jgi:Tol biopolymer transport system component
VRLILPLAALMSVSAFAAPGPERVWADGSTNTLGAPSPDGRFLSFVDASTGNLAVRDTATAAIRILTKATGGEFAYFSSISPDSKRIAYAWFNSDRFYELRVIGIDGTDDTVLHRNEEAGFVQPCAWSPDGRYILTLLFRRDNISQIALVPLDGGPPRILKSLNWMYPKRMDFSPDGKHVIYDAFARGGSGQRDIYMLAADGSKETVVVQHKADDLFPLWSPDGKWIYFASDRSGAMALWRQAAHGGEATLVQSNIGRFLPMGITRAGLLYFGVRDGDTDIYAARITDGNPARIPTRFPSRNAAPAWSPDGSSIAFLSRRGTENYGQDSRVITIRNITSGEERDLQSPMAHIERVRWSPDGKSFLVSGSDGKGRSGLFIADATTGKLAPVATNPEATFRGYDGAWINEKKVVYARGQALWLGDRELRKLECEPALLAASSDQMQIAFACGNAVYAMGLDTSELTRVAQISEKHHINGVAWTPSGDILFACGPTLFRASTGHKASLIATLKDSHGDIALHPDGSTIAFTSGATRSEVWTLRVGK